MAWAQVPSIAMDPSLRRATILITALCWCFVSATPDGSTVDGATRRLQLVNSSQQKAFDLEQAIKRGDVTAAKQLLSDFPEILDSQNAQLMTPLHQAVYFNRPQIVQLLIDLGANKELKYRGSTPLHLAAQLGALEPLKILMKTKAVINVRNDLFETPLHVAPVEDAVEVVEALLNAGALINAKDLKGQTPLHEAAIYGAENSIKVLIRRGADAKQVDYEGQAPMDVVCKCLEFVGTLLARCAPRQCTEADKEAVKKLLTVDKAPVKTDAQPVAPTTFNFTIPESTANSNDTGIDKGNDKKQKHRKKKKKLKSDTSEDTSTMDNGVVPIYSPITRLEAKLKDLDMQRSERAAQQSSGSGG